MKKVTDIENWTDQAMRHWRFSLTLVAASVLWLSAAGVSFAQQASPPESGSVEINWGALSELKSRPQTVPQPITAPVFQPPAAPVKPLKALRPAAEVLAVTAPPVPAPQDLDPGSESLLLQLSFRGQSDDLSGIAIQQLSELAERMRGLAGRLQVRSYASPTDGTSGSARKLSFKRALAVRSFLIEEGVRSSRVDLRALGPADDGGEEDRVDIILTTG